MGTPLLAAVSVDLDELPHYFALHGLSARDETAHLVYERALPRLADWASGLGLKLSLFAVGTDLEHAPSAAALRRLSDLGHEVENHSWSHRYDLTRLGREQQRREVHAGAEAIERVTGRRPQGFRAPGYTVTRELLEEVEASGASYDSSVFPCPAYYLAKLGVRSWMRLRGRRSSSIVDHPQSLGAPTGPYRIGRRPHERGQGLLELPIQVTRGPRLPFIGTALTLAGPRGAALLTAGVSGLPLVNLELHGVDVLDVTDGLEELGLVQRDLRVPVAQKLEILTRVVERLRTARHRFVSLSEASRIVT